MLTFSTRTRIFLVAGVTDMRKAFDGLAAIVANHLNADPLSGDVFAFCNRKRNRIKILVWDSNGLWVCAKRLEKGTFAWPQTAQKSMLMTTEELTLLIGGLDLQHVERRRWFKRRAADSERRKKLEEKILRSSQSS